MIGRGALAPDGDAAAALRALPELSPLGDRELRQLLAHFDEATVRAGTRLVTAGRLAPEYLVVVEGRLEAVGNCGRWELGPGQSAGWEQIQLRSPAPASITAVQDSRLLVMGPAQFRAVRAVLPPEPVRLSKMAAGRPRSSGDRAAVS